MDFTMNHLNPWKISGSSARVLLAFTGITRRYVFSWASLSEAYRRLWQPPSPPYKHVCQVGDPILRQKAEGVPKNDICTEGIQKVIGIMKNVMHSYGAFGLAAPQIGIPLQIIMVEVPAYIQKYFSSEVWKSREMELVPFTVIINPETRILNNAEVKFPEGCESLKGYSAVVPRYKEVSISGYNERGEEVKWHTKGWTARIVQHEMDHLEGQLFIDIMDSLTFEYDKWLRVNVRGGKYHQKFYGKV